MTSVMTPQPNPNPFGLRWKLGEYLNRAMTPKVISSETQSSKAASPSFGNAAAVTDKPWGQLPPSLPKPWRRLHRGQYPEGQRQSLKWTEMSLIKTSFPASETFAWEGRYDLPGLVWKPRQESNERQLKEGRAAWSVFLITSWSLFCWNIFCSSLVNRAELVRGERQNHLTGISLSRRSTMCRGSQRTRQPVLCIMVQVQFSARYQSYTEGRTSARPECQEFLNNRHSYAQPKALSYLNIKQFLLSLKSLSSAHTSSAKLMQDPEVQAVCPYQSLFPQLYKIPSG